MDVKQQGVKEIIDEIRSGLSQTSSSTRDEIRVMKALLNDKEFKVGIYDKNGKVGERCPSQEIRSMISGVVASTTKITNSEAEQLVDGYEFKKSDAVTMIDFSKDYINTALSTGRKIPLGATESSNISISKKVVEAKTRHYPKRVGVNDDGSPRCETAEATVPAHESIRVFSPCPTYIK